MNDKVLGWGLLTATVILVVLGCALYALGSVGWAQLMWVLASGTAGAGIVMVAGRNHEQ